MDVHPIKNGIFIAIDPDPSVKIMEPYQKPAENNKFQQGAMDRDGPLI